MVGGPRQKETRASPDVDTALAHVLSILNITRIKFNILSTKYSLVNITGAGETNQ